MKRLRLVLLAIICILGAARQTCAQSFMIEDIGSLPGGEDVEGWSINDSGQISGTMNWATGGYQHGFRTSGNGVSPIVLTDLGMTGGLPGTRAYGINASGQVAGYSYDNASGVTEAFRSSGNASSSVTLTNFGGTHIQATDINNNGEFTGQSNSHAFRSSANGNPVQLNDLGVLSGKNTSIGYGINSSGQVAGYSWQFSGSENRVAFRSSPTASATQTLTSLGLIQQGDHSLGLGINDQGEVVGAANLTPGGVEHAFISSGNGSPTVTMTLLGTLGTDQESRAWAVNNQGEVVGDADIGIGRSHAFLYTTETGMQDLNTLIPANTGITLSEALGINNLGQIMAWGSVPGSNFIHTFRLTPAAQTPEPGSVTTLLSSALVVGMLWKRSRRRIRN